MIESVASLTKTPPHNLEAEQSTLGSMLMDRPACDRAAEILQATDFYRPANQTIFETILTLTERDEPIDVVTVCEELQANGQLEKVGGREYIVALLDAVPSAANVDYYARIVEEKSILRRLLTASNEIQGLGYSENEDVTDLVDRAEQIIYKVAKRREGQDFSPLPPLLHDAWERIEHASRNKGATMGVPTGFRQIDLMTNGLQGGDLIVIAARPSMGKTALALNISVNAALEIKQPVAVFSMEMSKEQLVQRMICSLAKVDGYRLRTGHLREGDWDNIVRTSTSLETAPLYIDDSTECSVMAMRTKCRRLKSRHGLSLVMVDYLQLMHWHRRVENRNQEISEISGALKSMARELDVPVVILSQLSRQTERREGNRPMLSDLRESGAIEQDADIVTFIYRPEYYASKEVKMESPSMEDEGDFEQRDDNQGEVAEIIIAKHRNGPVGTVKLSFIPRFASFENLAYNVDEPD